MSGEVVLRNNLRNVSRALRSENPATTHVGHCRWNFGLCSRDLGGADVARKERGQAGSKQVFRSRATDRAWQGLQILAGR